MSVYALSRGLAAILFAPAVGYYIDTGNRLRVVQVSIGCDSRRERPRKSEKSMNAQMRRIDLICKLIGPLFIAFIDSSSPKTAICVNFGMSASSVVIEYASIAQVYRRVHRLQDPKPLSTSEALAVQSKASTIWSSCCTLAQKSLADFSSYFHHRMFLPSFAGALLYLTVLSFSGQMVTWLLAAGYDSTQISAARAWSVIFEVLATWVAPSIMGKIGPIRAVKAKTPAAASLSVLSDAAAATHRVSSTDFLDGDEILEYRLPLQKPLLDC
ncbi:hypothetical protein PENANT_c001G03003 [Penicillium antarcticum]|uniref:Solute carrier family 40 member n=1 Tax=Penicillium antarcticum TaxID=416450 RepID=A0A1V6QN02_9EURO|nr:hypothetical protein PENANT_c001G03003 [Penicillium antarcticum]